MNKIIIPNVNNNETEAELVSWEVDDDSTVSKGDVIAVLETTKATVDLESEFNGKIKILSEINNKYNFGTVIGYVYNDKSELDGLDILIEDDKSDLNEITITKPARDFMIKNNIDESQVKKLNLSLVKLKDIESLYDKPESNNLEILIDPKQLTISNTVLNSKKTIPDAFQLKKININNALIKIDTISSENNFVFGIPELIIHSISKLINEFPFFFGRIINENKFLISQSSNIGVTIDIGKGLFVPVIHDCQNLSLKEISTILMGFKMKAIRNNYKSSDFDNPSISISLNMDNDTVFVKPIIFPGQTCMISINSVFNECILQDKKIIENKYINLGLAYDHRVINGYEANKFLTTIKNFVEEKF